MIMIFKIQEKKEIQIVTAENFIGQNILFLCQA